jgi:hypothetical protein
MYSEKITDRERQLGYYVARMPNPEGCGLFRKPQVDAVMYQLDRDNLVVKVAPRRAREGFTYSHQQRDGGLWKTVQAAEPDPEAALWSANARMEQRIAPPR